MGAPASATVITAGVALGQELNRNIQAIAEEAAGRISRGEAAELLELAEAVQEATGGAFSPFLGEIIGLWGINEPEREHGLPRVDEFFPALERSKSGLGQVDLDAVGMGYALDRVNDYLESRRVQNALVSFGGSTLALGMNRGGNLWMVGISDPLDPGRMAGVVQARDKFISVAAAYERYVNIGGINYAHIIDPATGYPVSNDLVGVAVVMGAKSAATPRARRERLEDNGAVADALARALLVMGRQGALDFYMRSELDFEMILFYRSEDDPRGFEIVHTNVAFSGRD